MRLSPWNADLTSLDKFRLMVEWDHTRGGICLPWPAHLRWDEYTHAQKMRLARIREGWERDRVRRETGIEIFDAVPLAVLGAA